MHRKDVRLKMTVKCEGLGCTSHVRTITSIVDIAETI